MVLWDGNSQWCSINVLFGLADTAATAAAHVSAQSMLDRRLFVRRIDGYWTASKRPTASCSTSTSGERAEEGCDLTIVFFFGIGLDPFRAALGEYDTVPPSGYRCMTYEVCVRLDDWS